MQVITHKLKAEPQVWMDNLLEELKKQIPEMRPDHVWTTGCMRYEPEEELDLKVQYDDCKDSLLCCSIHMSFHPDEKEYENHHHGFSTSMKIDMNRWTPKEFADYIMKLYKDQCWLVDFHKGTLV